MLETLKPFMDQGSGAWPYGDLSLLKVKESLIVNQRLQERKCVYADMHTSANILHVCMHKNVLTIL